MFNLVVLVDLKKALGILLIANSIKQTRALWNKRTSYKFAQILSHQPKTKVPNKKLIFI